MSSLHEKVAERRAAQASELQCVSAQPGSFGLLVAQWRRETWVLPWSHFACARFSGSDDEGRLELSFSNHTVTVTGAHLRGLLVHLAAARLDSIRDLPAQYRSSASEERPFIARIEVRWREASVEPEIRESS